MSKIFVSCGQFTEAEKSVGKEIVRIVTEVTGIDAFFAEQVQDLNGLDSNILNALRECAGFITVIHPRGTIARPDGSTHVRASVWIEQEIAIAAYIQFVEKRSLPVIAFIHETVGREGIRDLLHLNPILFRNESEIIAALPQRLSTWTELTKTGIRLLIHCSPESPEGDHGTRHIILSIQNETNERITPFNGQVRVPAGIFEHWPGVSSFLPREIPSSNPMYRCFRFDETYAPKGIAPHFTQELVVLPCCLKCAISHTGKNPRLGAAAVKESAVQAKVWIGGSEYEAESTIGDLLRDAESSNS